MHKYLNDHQKNAVAALKNLKSICEKHEITYYLLAGSTLGAVRHQGFIPWDDDIDIGILYDDWYQLREILVKEMPKDFVYKDIIINPNFGRFMGKILYKGESPLIDIFILVKWPGNNLSGFFHWQIKQFASQCYLYSIHVKHLFRPNVTNRQKAKYYITNFFRRIIYFILHFFYNRDDFIRLARWNEKYFMNDNTDYYINIYSIYKMEKEMIKKKWLQNPSQVLFEDEYYTTVSDTDAYLTHLYGDYMTPPPIKNRVKRHDEKLTENS